MIKKLVGALAAATALLLFTATLTPPATAADLTTEQTAAAAALPWPYTSPNPEVWESATSQQQATDWVNRCPSGRFCTWIRDGSSYSLFQFYRCGIYALNNFNGISNFYNNQNVRVELQGSRHEPVRYESPGYKFITNWDPIWYINLCA
ncbi:hypothetical protein OHA70_32020 [Kribbella sp. NBC_00382]|uniref:hypothetical protein n=1 Tax=Kribbella sp. NBC_00382 TaxID=2975967 RepID=UPI002E1C9FAC